METIRYAREELLQWQYEAVEAGCWEAMVASMGAPLYQELCSLSQLPDHQIHVSANLQRNINKHHRPPVSTINPLSQALNEEEVEDQDDSDEEVSLQPLAFQVHGEPNFDSGPPQDGFEYLRRVMWETARCPKVKVARIGEKKLSKQTNYMPEIQPIPVCPLDILPSKDWVQEFLKDFSDLRTGLANASYASMLGEDTLKELPPIQDKACWRSVCLGKSSNKKPLEKQEEGESSSVEKHEDEGNSSFQKHEEGNDPSPEQQYKEGNNSLLGKHGGGHISSFEKHEDGEITSVLEDEILKANDDDDVFRVSSSIDEEEILKANDKDIFGGSPSIDEDEILKTNDDDDVFKVSCTSIDEDEIPEANNDSVSRVVSCAPLLKMVLRLDEVSRATLFRYHVSWLKESGNLSYGNAVWLFSLSAVVDTPLDDQTCAAFRELLRICAKLRMEKKLDDEELHMLNILITVAGEYFGQADRSTEMKTNC